ncbi:Hypothetical protein SRAE_2000192000 [Strongyloides ratti]|uniref:Uncharacterized protein n=1 Tax=Strongyloides ratti TaxID=34506 RepID=A0A090LBV9_STRRB|nr:Hypothetical protein SRAE_2000192000 [Strongyloides ratti]CEF67256.1 Hypothetical protein SRAE_2000192000 [Strongyloides ratti]
MISINLQVTSLLRSNNILYKNFCHSTTLLIITEFVLTIDTFLALLGWLLYRNEKKKGMLNVKVLETQRIVSNSNFNNININETYRNYDEPSCCQEHYYYNNAQYIEEQNIE